MKKNLIKSVVLAGMFLTGTSLFAETHFSIGVGIGSPGYYGPAPVYSAPAPAYPAPAYDGYSGAPPAPPAYAAVRPPYPGPGYTWIDGYWYPDGGRYAWRAGYWAMPPYAGGYWVAPRYYGGRYYNGYWGHRGGDRDDYRYRSGYRGDHDHDRGRGYGYGFRH
jgi:hypothetical protein